jgi:twitching motility protein PilT
MARLDAFIEKLVAAPGGELVFQTAQGALLAAPEGPRRLVRQPLSTSQIVGAFAEIVPPELQVGFPGPGETVFAYHSPSGAVEVRFEATADAVRAVVRPLLEARAPEPFDPSPAPFEDPAWPARGEEDAAGRLAAPPAAPAPAPGAALPPRATPTSPAGAAPAFPRSGSLTHEPRPAMDRLLDDMLDRRASDLHLSSGSVPVLRVDGDVVPAPEYGPISPERLAARFGASPRNATGRSSRPAATPTSHSRRPVPASA